MGVKENNIWTHVSFKKIWGVIFLQTAENTSASLGQLGIFSLEWDVKKDAMGICNVI